MIHAIDWRLEEIEDKLQDVLSTAVENKEFDVAQKLLDLIRTVQDIRNGD